MNNFVLLVKAAIVVVVGIQLYRVVRKRTMRHAMADSRLAPRNRKRFVWASSFVLAVVGTSGLALFAPSEPVSAAPISIDQCNGVSNTGGLTVQCSIVVVNNLTGDPLTTNAVVTLNGGAPQTFAGDTVVAVNQCNGSANGGGGSLLCTVSITNNITVTGGSAPGAATINQCNANDPDGLGTAPNVCVPFPATTTGATITQCNGSGNGGGLVFPSGCTASGTVSASLPVTINQCNGSANGGGSRVVCSSTMLTNVFAVPPTTPPTTTGEYPPVPPAEYPPVPPTGVGGAGGGIGAGPGPSLPRTGANSWPNPLVGGGVLLTGLGGLVLAVGRRRAAHS